MSYYDYYMPEAFNSASDTYIDKVITWVCIRRSHDYYGPQKRCLSATWEITLLSSRSGCLDVSCMDQSVVDSPCAELGEPVGGVLSSPNIVWFILGAGFLD